MKKIALKFQSPSKLNEVETVLEAEKRNWIHFEFEGFDNGFLELDLESGEILCEDKNIKASVDEWEVNEEKYLMKLKTEDSQDTYAPLDYTFAVSMFGQLFSTNELIKYLQIIDKLYMEGGDKQYKKKK